jgi:hypothetical protein
LACKQIGKPLDWGHMRNSAMASAMALTRPLGAHLCPLTIMLPGCLSASHGPSHFLSSVGVELAVPMKGGSKSEVTTMLSTASPACVMAERGHLRGYRAEDGFVGHNVAAVMYVAAAAGVRFGCLAHFERVGLRWDVDVDAADQRPESFWVGGARRVSVCLRAVKILDSLRRAGEHLPNGAAAPA